MPKREREKENAKEILGKRKGEREREGTKEGS